MGKILIRPMYPFFGGPPPGDGPVPPKERSTAVQTKAHEALRVHRQEHECTGGSHAGRPAALSAEAQSAGQNDRADILCSLVLKLRNLLRSAANSSYFFDLS